VANVVSGRVVSIGITNPGANYTEAPTVTVGWLSMEDLDPRDNTIYLNASVGGTTSLAISSVLNTTSMGWWDQGWGTPSGFSSAGSSASCAEVLVDEETGEVEVTGIWNVVDTGGTIFKRGAIKEMLSGCELIIAQTLFFGDIYDHAHSGALIGTMYSQSQTPTSMDLPCNNYHVFDYESNDCGPYGAHGIGEPAVSCVSAIYGAIYNAIGVFPDPEHGALNPDRVLKALGKA
jgi:CO/xanthine dehydrogenase Mo-binding subunit